MESLSSINKNELDREEEELSNDNNGIQDRSITSDSKRVCKRHRGKRRNAISKPILGNHRHPSENTGRRGYFFRAQELRNGDTICQDHRQKLLERHTGTFSGQPRIVSSQEIMSGKKRAASSQERNFASRKRARSSQKVAISSQIFKQRNLKSNTDTQDELRRLEQEREYIKQQLKMLDEEEEQSREQDDSEIQPSGYDSLLDVMEILNNLDEETEEGKENMSVPNTCKQPSFLNQVAVGGSCKLPQQISEIMVGALTSQPEMSCSVVTPSESSVTAGNLHQDQLSVLSCDISKQTTSFNVLNEWTTRGNIQSALSLSSDNESTASCIDPPIQIPVHYGSHKEKTSWNRLRVPGKSVVNNHCMSTKYDAGISRRSTTKPKQIFGTDTRCLNNISLCQPVPKKMKMSTPAVVPVLQNTAEGVSIPGNGCSGYDSDEEDIQSLRVKLLEDVQEKRRTVVESPANGIAPDHKPADLDSSEASLVFEEGDELPVEQQDIVRVSPSVLCVSHVDGNPDLCPDSSQLLINHKQSPTVFCELKTTAEESSSNPQSQLMLQELICSPSPTFITTNLLMELNNNSTTAVKAPRIIQEEMSQVTVHEIPFFPYEIVDSCMQKESQLSKCFQEPEATEAYTKCFTASSLSSQKGIHESSCCSVGCEDTLSINLAALPSTTACLIKADIEAYHAKLPEVVDNSAPFSQVSSDTGGIISKASLLSANVQGTQLSPPLILSQRELQMVSLENCCLSKRTMKMLEYPTNVNSVLDSAVIASSVSQSRQAEKLSITNEQILLTESALELSTAEFIAQLSPAASAAHQSPNWSTTQTPPVELTVQLSPVESTAQLNSVESTAQLNPVESTAQLNPFESTEQICPVESTTQIYPDESTSQLNQLESAAQLNPLEPTSQLNPAESTAHICQVESPAHISEIESTAQISPVDSTTQLSTIESTAQQTTVESTAQPSMAESTVHISTAESAVQMCLIEFTAPPSMAESTAHISPVESTAQPSTAESTVHISPVESTAQPYAADATAQLSTNESTAQPSTAESTAQLSTNESTAQPSTAESTVHISPVESTVQPYAAESTAHTSPVESTVQLSTAESTVQMCPVESRTRLCPAKPIAPLSTADCTTQMPLSRSTAQLSSGSLATPDLTICHSSKNYPSNAAYSSHLHMSSLSEKPRKYRQPCMLPIHPPVLVPLTSSSDSDDSNDDDNKRKTRSQGVSDSMKARHTLGDQNTGKPDNEVESNKLRCKEQELIHLEQSMQKNQAKVLVLIGKKADIQKALHAKKEELKQLYSQLLTFKNDITNRQNCVNLYKDKIETTQKEIQLLGQRREQCQANNISSEVSESAADETISVSTSACQSQISRTDRNQSMSRAEQRAQEKAKLMDRLKKSTETLQKLKEEAAKKNTKQFSTLVSKRVRNIENKRKLLKINSFAKMQTQQQ